MKAFLLTLLGLVVFSSALAQNPAPRRDWFIFLERGKPTPNDAEAVAAMQKGHLDNFGRLFGEGKLFAAGPMRDPSGVKRGIVTVKASTKDDLMSYFQPDQYVRDGYMTVNAAPCRVQKALNTQGIDPNGIEEVRIVLISRPAAPLMESQKAANHAFLQKLVDQGRAGAWYTLETGDVAEVIFWNTKDTAMLDRVFSFYPSTRNGDASVKIWGQWLSKGVVK